MKLPLFGESLYDERTYTELLNDELQILLYTQKCLEPLLSRHVFKRLKEEDWRLSNYYSTIAMVVSVLLNEEVEENSDLLFVPISDFLANKILNFSTLDFLDFFDDSNLRYSMDWVVSEFFDDEFSLKFKDIDFDFSSLDCWSELEYLDCKKEDRNIYELFDIPLSEYIRKSILQFDEKKGCYFLMISFYFLSGELISDAFFNIYDQNYLFKIGVLQEEVHEKKN